MSVRQQIESSHVVRDVLSVRDGKVYTEMSGDFNAIQSRNMKCLYLRRAYTSQCVGG